MKTLKNHLKHSLIALKFLGSMANSICASQSTSKFLSLVDSARQCATELESLILVITRELELRERKEREVLSFDRLFFFYLTLVR